MEKKIDIKDALFYAWEIFKANPVQHILVVLAISIISQVTGMIIEGIAGSNLKLVGLLNLVDFLTVGALTSMFLFVYSILQTRKSDKSVQDILSSIFDFDLWWKYVATSLLSTIAIVAGLILLIVPGIILAIALMFASYYVVDYKENPIDALKKSWALTDGHRWTLFALIIVLAVLNIFGMLAFLIGLFVTVPVSMFAVAHVYNILTDAYDEYESEHDEDGENEQDSDEEDEEQETDNVEEEQNKSDADEENEQ